MNDLPKTTEERIDRLEKLYEKIYHDYELLSILIPRLTDILGKYWEASGKHRENTIAQIRGIQSFTGLVDKDIQQHFKNHSTDTLKKKESYYKKSPDFEKRDNV